MAQILDAMQWRPVAIGCCDLLVKMREEGRRGGMRSETGHEHESRPDGPKMTKLLVFKEAHSWKKHMTMAVR
jgi:hypothetical protein